MRAVCGWCWTAFAKGVAGDAGLCGVDGGGAVESWVRGERMTTTDDVLHNKYSLVKGAARRARQLQGGAPAMIISKSMKACRVAQDEIEQGHVSYRFGAKKVIGDAKVLEMPAVQTASLAVDPAL